MPDDVDLPVVAARETSLGLERWSEAFHAWLVSSEIQSEAALRWKIPRVGIGPRARKKTEQVCR
jgi:hypothetical protein